MRRPFITYSGQNPWNCARESTDMGKWPERLRNKSDAMQLFTADLVYAIIGSTIYVQDVEWLL